MNGKTYAIADLHGEYELFKSVQGFLAEDDKCYVLGDCIDRGHQGIKILLELREDPRFILLKGNHEDMLIDVVLNYWDNPSSVYETLPHFFSNGGKHTWKYFMALKDEEQTDLIHYLQRRPVYIKYGNVHLSHAGFDYKTPRDKNNTEKLLWGRSHLGSKARGKVNEFQVHGHTPTGLINREYEGVVANYHPQKMCIDIGAHWVKEVAIVDLDSLVVRYLGGNE